MRSLDYQSILARVYGHFAIYRHPLGLIGGSPCYHQGASGDPIDIDCPCAIGLFDDQHRLNDPDLAMLDVATLFAQRPDVLNDIFDVDSLTREDAGFLLRIQDTHDFHALDRDRKPWRPTDTFHDEIADGLKRIASDYKLPALAS